MGTLGQYVLFARDDGTSSDVFHVSCPCSVVVVENRALVS